MTTLQLFRVLNDGNLKHARQLLEDGADPNHVLEEGGVAGVASMHMAAGLSAEALRLLLEYDGDPNVRSIEGLTPLHIAATWGELDSVKILLFNGGDPSLKDQDGLRAVDVGRSYSHSEVVCFLEYYSLLLIPEGEDDTELRYTRESLDAGRDSLSRNTTPDVLNLSFQEDCSPDQSLTTAARRSSVITALQQKLDRCVQHGEHFCMDVTSPTHPYLERKSGATNGQELCSGKCERDSKWTPRKRQTCVHQESKQRTSRGLFERYGDRCWNCNEDRHEEYCGYHRRGRHCGHDNHVSFTDSDPDCWEGGRGDEVRDRLRDFHKSCVRIRKPTANSGCFQDHCSQCDQTLSSNCHHCSKSTPYCHKNSRLGINYCDMDMNAEIVSAGHMTTANPRMVIMAMKVQHRTLSKKMPKKIPSDPVVPKWTLLKDKQETSAEKVGRWQTSLSSGLHKPPHCEVGYKSSSTDDAHFSPSRFIHSPKLSEVKSPMSQNSSPNRFFPPLSDHQYNSFSPSAVYDERSTQSDDYGNGMSWQEQSPKSSLGFTPQTKSGTGSRIYSGNSRSSPHAAAPRTPESRSICKSAPRRSSMYTQNIQRELEKHLQDGHRVCLDVTSPGHPFVDFKSKELQKLSDAMTVLSPVERVSHVRSPGGASPGAQGKRLSTVSTVSASSCDTFVTCEDDTEFTLVTPLDPTVSVDTQSFSSGTSKDSVVLNVKAVVTDENKSGPNDNYGSFGISCSVCDDKDRSQYKVVLTEESKKRESSPTTLRLTSPVKHNRHPSHPLLDDELDLTTEVRQGNGCKTAGPDKSPCRMASQNNKAMVQTDSRTFSPSKHHWQHPVPDKVLDVSDLITSHDSFTQRIEKKTNKADNISGNVTPRHSGKKDLAGCYSKWLPPSDMNLLDETDLISSDESFQIREREKKAKDSDRITSLVEKLKKVSVNTGMRTSPLKSGKRSPVKPGNKRVSMDSFCSNASVREYLYKDKEKGITLLERYVPSECEESSTRESLDSTCSIFTINSEDTEIYDWQDYQSDTDDGRKVTGQKINQPKKDGEPKKPPIPQHLSQLSNQAIRKKLLSLGDDPGPVMATTRQTYLVRLASLEADPTRAHMMKLTVDGPEYSPELRAALQNNLDCEGVDDLEDKLVASFQNTQGRIWREGTLKSSFNYLLLDPRVTKNLPYRAKTLGEGETFKAFIHAIFYVGKGKRARPYCHLYEAISHMQKPKPKVSTKVQHIIDIWNEGLGVVSLHCFQSVIPVEAYTREACMVEAIGLTKLTNMKRGDYYGVASTWPLKTKRKMGVHLLKKALQIFLSEGERQICPVDIKGGQ
ncbi:LOW QUALITY PROTEIN: uncharacterized protein LOC124255839 [Haliotis rubra]|uniref:LOW QUALITY PROTEIN: uncharacterized protein LOC124255839 n=1 Tax=Haliotis rubra TaxID=36100 RepID=UPI001EE584CE|nr:LOW QUALITY PROTEIN: uncharacterized protein LOC124255839 [Haliotis rubra]